MSATDVEINRALNALTTTFNDQRMQRLDSRRAQEIIDGALAGEHKLNFLADGDAEGRVVSAPDGALVANVSRDGGRWVAVRVKLAQGSDWALPENRS